MHQYVDFVPDRSLKLDTVFRLLSSLTMKSNESKMPLTRQVRHYQKSRDNWKENAAEKQRTLRSYLQLTRSLKKSRDNWKLRCDG